MKIAVASGKGGTGKTMVATSMAAALSPNQTVQYVDCDVEAPNSHLFLKPSITETKSAVIKIPKIDIDQCVLCGKCVDICEFNALAMLGQKIFVFEQLCHGCGSCTIHCPYQAIEETSRKIGEIKSGRFNKSHPYLYGELTISEPMPTPIIYQVKRLMKKNLQVTILDSPPGTSCSVVATLHDVDFVILVTEPTPFGLHDLKQTIGLLEKFGKPAGVIINREGIGNSDVENYLSGTIYPVLMKIPFQENIAKGLAKGDLLIDIIPELRNSFLALFSDIKTEVKRRKMFNAN